jgi:DNA-binding transcriptional LysR family regulator
LCKGEEQVNVRGTGQLIFNGVGQIADAAVAGYGLAFMPEETVAPYMATGKLEVVMEDWAPTFPGLHLYYASRHQPLLARGL